MEMWGSEVKEPKNLTVAALLAGALALLTTRAFASPPPEQKCQAAKNMTAGKYVACRYNAEAKLATSGTVWKYTEASAKCATKFTNAWQKAIGRAKAKGATCLDAPLAAGNFQSVIDEHIHNVATALGGAGFTDCTVDLVMCTNDLETCSEDLSSCSFDLSTCTAGLAQSQSYLANCNGYLSTCNGSLSTCNGNLSSCSASLVACNSNYTNCSADLGTANAGTAVQANVLAGKTFSSSAGLGVAGTMANNGAMNITPSATAQTIPAGYHNGAGAVVGDPDLVAANIKNGVVLFGITGTFFGPGVQPPPLKTGQTTSYGASSDGDLQKGASRSYTDNGDGTITDNTTGLMWEKKSDDGGIHDKDNAYAWGMNTSPFTMTGTMVTAFVATLNGGGGFAGYKDWRIPNVNEVHTLVDYGNAGPSVSPTFQVACVPGCTVLTCSCTASGYYWSSTTLAQDARFAWSVYFLNGTVWGQDKGSTYYVRAVRGGL